MTKKITLIPLLLLTLTITTLAGGKHQPEITPKARQIIALKTLKKSPNSILVFAKGLVCESCAIGIRKKLQRLKFINTKMPKKGITLDVYSQLVTITLKPKAPINKKAITKAIKSAGYKPITLFILGKNNKLITHPLTQ